MKIIELVLMAIPCFLLVITIHELGHIIAGMLSGFRFEMLVIGPFGLKRNEDHKVIFYIEKNISMWGGMGATVPVNENKDNLDKFANVIIGGPLLSLLFGIAMIWLFIYNSHSFLLLLGAMAIGISIATLIPSRFGGFYSDGGRWLRIKRNGKDAMVEKAIFNFVQSGSVNGNYSKLIIEDTRLLIEDSDYRNQYLGHYFAYHYFKDNKDFKNADEELNSMAEPKAHVSKSFVKMLTVD